MNKDVEPAPVDEDPCRHTEDEQAHEGWMQSKNAARLGLLAELEFSRRRELSARHELQQARDDTARARKTYEGILDDAKQRSLIQIEIERAENDHLKRSIADLEAAARKAQEAFTLGQAELSAVNTELILKLSELEAVQGTLEATVQSLEKEASSANRTMLKKEAFGRDKARRLDSAMKVLAQERSRLQSLENSSALRIGRLITTSLRNPGAAIALFWRLPKLIFVESRNNTGGTLR